MKERCTYKDETRDCIYILVGLQQQCCSFTSFNFEAKKRISKQKRVLTYYYRFSKPTIYCTIHTVILCDSNLVGGRLFQNLFSNTYNDFSKHILLKKCTSNESFNKTIYLKNNRILSHCYISYIFITC